MTASESLITIPMVARSLNETRRETAAYLRDQVDAVTNASDQELERKVLRLPGDPWALRGLPMVGRDCIGGAIPGTRPGDGLFDDE
jgi:hypothetical protein